MEHEINARELLIICLSLCSQDHTTTQIRRAKGVENRIGMKITPFRRLLDTMHELPR
ncbi:MAG: hypothetical protein RLZZ224_1309 [Verrucomicrobiota bacterium]